MKANKRFFILFGCILALLLVTVVILLKGNKQTVYEPANDNSPTPSSSAAVQTTPAPSVIALDQSFMTDSKEPQVLWQEDRKQIFVQNLHIYYTSDGAAELVLYEWDKAGSAHAWLNGEYLLIGTQLIEGESDTNGGRGSWVAIRISASPSVIAEENASFGPREVLSVGLSNNPRLFFVKWDNNARATEEVFDPSHSEWVGVANWRGDLSSVDLSTDAPERYDLAEPQVYPLGDGITVYTFTDELGDAVYSRVK